MSFPTLFAAVLAALLPASSTGSPEPVQRRVRINLGTLAPKGSSYYQSLAKMGQRWKELTGGKVQLTIYPDGRLGSEDETVQLMRTGSAHAGLLSGVGLAEIEPTVTGVQSLPMMFQDLEEFEYVYAELRPDLEKRLYDKGFRVLFWIDGGWVRQFTKVKTETPAELKTRKFWTWAGDPVQEAIMRDAGYRPVPLETAQIVTGLQTGLIDAVNLPPIIVLKSQIDTRAPHMLELNYAPLIGAAVVANEVWDRIPTEFHAEMLEIALEVGAEVQIGSREESDEAVAAMVKRGLTVHPVDAKLNELWREAARDVYPQLRGRIVPEETFDRVVALVAAYREQRDAERQAPPTDGGTDK